MSIKVDYREKVLYAQLIQNVCKSIIFLQETKI